MRKTSRLIVAAAFAVLALFAFAGPASGQTVDTTPGVDAYVAGVTTIAPQAQGVQVQGVAQVRPSGALPYTGNDSLPMVQIGIALLAVGALVTFAVRKRNHAEIS